MGAKESLLAAPGPPIMYLLESAMWPSADGFVSVIGHLRRILGRGMMRKWFHKFPPKTERMTVPFW